MSDETKKVVLVGHCGPDSYALRSAVGSIVPGAEVVFINDEASLSGAAADLVLVNRVLEGDFVDENGIALIGILAAAGARVMLISNYADAQAEAVRAGAMPGFGKMTMYADEAREKIQHALTGSPRRSGS